MISMRKRKRHILPSDIAVNPVTIDILNEHPEWIAAIPDCEALVQRVCHQVLQATSFLDSVSECELSVVLADDDFIQALNKQYRGKDAPTNVLSFPGEALKAGDYKEFAGQREPLVLGDIILSLDTLQREAKDQGKNLQDHYCHLLVHGALHVLGYDHETDEDATIMERKEIEILRQFNINSPYEALEE